MRVITSVSAIMASLSGDHGELLEDIFTSGAEGVAPAPAVQSATVAPAPVAPTLAKRVADFLRTDQSGFDWRSAGAIAKALGDASDLQVADAARASGELQVRNSTSGLGVLVSLRD